MSQIELGIDIGRVVDGISKIGYTTASALCDIIDNSVRAKAKNIYLLIEKERKDFSDSRKNNVKEYMIIDDGDGMSNKEILNALMLGSSDFYEDHSLAKFGLGLKSASFSQGDVLQIISSDGDSEFKKYKVDLISVIAEKKYFATEEPLNESDLSVIGKYLNEKKGTIIKISNVRKNNHPSVKKTFEELYMKMGVIYYYFLNQGLKIYIGNKNIEANDPLWVEEADRNGILNEHEWDGKSVRWIEKQQDLLLDIESNTSIKIEITQLPYPPIFNLEERGKDLEVRQKYNIGAGNYGFYVYRNERLISWANQFQGIIPSDQDFYAFRGRILLSDTADDFFNIDVKKSSLTLSDEAWNIISDFCTEGKRKSKNAWINANNYRKELVNKSSLEISDRITDDLEPLDLLPGDELPSEEQATERVEAIQKEMEEKTEQMIQMYIEDEGEEIIPNQPISEEIKNIAIKGKGNINLQKVFRVSSVIDNLLWEPYYDTENKSCVRINKYHRFAKKIYEDNHPNKDLHIFFDLMLLKFAEAEIYTRKNSNHNYELVREIIEEFKRCSSEFLAELARKKDTELPPNYRSEE